MQMEFLCTLGLGAGAVHGGGGEPRPHIASATRQRKQKGLHPELAFVVVRVLPTALCLGKWDRWCDEQGSYCTTDARTYIPCQETKL